MKNFRKVLALVLVVATLFSFAAMAGAKSLDDYKDADQISYEYAVAVLSAVEVLNGYEDDTFKPTATISREEMAKMIAVLANAGDDVHELYAAANTFADVEAGRWSASYIAYCAQTGIVAGRTADTFDPYGKVTGLETAKMLLVTMGFSATEQGYVGANWKINVLRDAKNMGLLDGFKTGYDVDAAITREEAANMMLNALKANVVIGVLSENIIKVTNAAMVEKLGTVIKAELIDSNKGFVNLYGNVIVANETLANALYNGNLKLDVNNADCFGRKANGFTYIVNKIKKAEGTFVVGATATSTEFVDVDSVYKAQKDAEYTITVVKNGSTWINASKSAADWAAAETFTGNGVDTAIYVGSNNVTVNVIETFIDKVDTVSEYYGTFTLKNIGGKFSVEEDVAAGDYILFRVCEAAGHKAIYGSADAFTTKFAGHALHDYTVVKPTTVTVSYARDYAGTSFTGKHMNDCFFKTSEGTTYEYDANFGEIIEVGNAPEFDLPKAGDTKNVYLDKYGYVMLITDVPAAAASIAYIEEGSDEIYGISHSITGGSEWAVSLDIAPYTGAAVANVELGEISTGFAPNSALLNWYLDLYNNGGKTGSLVSYTVDADTGLAEIVKGGSYLKAGVISKDTKNVTLAYANETYGLTEDTVFMIRSTNPADGSWTYEEIVGRQNLTETYAVKTNDAQILNTNDDSYADYVFIDAKFVKVATEFFVLGTEYEASWTGIAGLGLTPDKYVAYRALVNGAESLVLFTAEQAAAVTKGGLYTGAVAYKGVTMVEDQNLNLYVYADSKGVEYYTASYGIAEINVVVKGSEVWVETYDETLNKNTQEVAGTDNLPVYHILKVEDNNDNTGYWTQYNKIDKTLLGEASRVFVVRNGAGSIIALYVLNSASGMPLVP